MKWCMKVYSNVIWNKLYYFLIISWFLYMVPDQLGSVRDVKNIVVKLMNWSRNLSKSYPGFKGCSAMAFSQAFEDDSHSKRVHQYSSRLLNHLTEELWISTVSTLFASLFSSKEKQHATGIALLSPTCSTSEGSFIWSPPP